MRREAPCLWLRRLRVRAVRGLLLLLPLLLAPAVAAEPVALVADGDPVRCISQRQLVKTRVVDERTIDFDVGGRIYRNRLQWACPNLAFEGSFRQFSGTAGLCEGDPIDTLNRGAPRESGTCRLGRFQPMKPAEGKERG